MATSTFYRNIYIDDKAADVIIKGLNSPKHPMPPLRSKEEIEWEKKQAEQLLSSLDKQEVTASS